MGHLFQVETNQVGYHLGVSLDDVRQVHKRIRHLALAVHHPCLLCLTQEMLQTFAHDRAARVNHEVGHVLLVVTYLHHGLVHQRVHRLTGNQHGALGLQEHPADVCQRDIRGIGRGEVYLTLLGECWRVKPEQRFRNGHVDMYGCMLLYQCLVNQSVAVPAGVLVVRFWQRYGFLDEASQGIRLRQGLTVELVYPLLRTVGTDDHYWLMLIIGFCYGRCQVEQCRATGDAYHHGLL